MNRDNHGLSGKAFFYCRNGVKWHFDGNMIAEKRKVMLVTTTFKIEKKNVDFSRILFIKTYDVFCYFLLFQDKMIDKIWKRSYSIRKVIL